MIVYLFETLDCQNFLTLLLCLFITSLHRLNLLFILFHLEQPQFLLLRDY